MGTNLDPPFLGQQVPLYPQVAESVRITTSTIPGPQGYGSSSLIAANLYLAYVQQVKTADLLPRDRIPCLVDDLNGLGLSPGYYSNARLSGSYGGLPVYAVAYGASGVGVASCCSNTLFVQTLPVTKTNVTTTNSVIGTGVGSMTLPANFWSVGRAVRLVARGVLGQGFLAGTVSWTISVQGNTFTTADIGGTQCTCLWIADIILTCLSVGSGTTQILIQGEILCYGDRTGGFSPSDVYDSTGFSPLTARLFNLDSTSTMFLDLLFAFGSLGSAPFPNSITSANAVLEDLRVGAGTVVNGIINQGNTNQLAYYAAAGNTLSVLTLGTNLSISSSILYAAGGSGGGGTTSPGGSNLDIQYNNAGSFGGRAVGKGLNTGDGKLNANIDDGTTNKLAYYAAAGNTVSPLGLGTNLTISSSFLYAAGGGGAGTPGGSPGQIQYNNAGAFGGFTASSDATVNTATGAVTVSKVLGKTAIVSDGSVAFAADQSMGSHKITSLTTGTADADAVNVGQLNAAVAALVTKADCQGATTTALAAATYANGSSGVGATLTLTVAAVLILDGYTPAINDRLLIKNQAAPAQNGIYVLTTVGTVIINAVLTRSTDFDQPAEVDGAITFIINGSTNAGTRWQCLTSGTVTFGTTAINWSTFLGSTYTADETTLHLSGTVFSVLNGYDLFSVAVNADVAATNNSAATLAYAKRTVVKATTYSSGTTPWTATLPAPALSGGKAQYLEITVDPTSTKPYTLTANSGENIGPGTATTRRMFAGESAILRTDGTNWLKIAGVTIPCLCNLRLTATTVGGYVPDGSFSTIVLFNSADVDNTSLMFDSTNHRVTIQRASNHFVNGTVIWSNLTQISPRTISALRVNGTPFQNGEGYGVVSAYPGIPASMLELFAVGDYIDLLAFQYSGTGAGQDIYGAVKGVNSACMLTVVEQPTW